MAKGERSKDGGLVDQSRRKFLKGCGLTILTTASYQVISIMAASTAAGEDRCVHGCVDACISSCTGCTTVNCTGGMVPDPGPPECVQGFKGDS